MSSRNIIDERAAYTKRAQDYTELVKKFTNPDITEVGNYRIANEIGSGAFGKIYLGYHKFLKTKIVLKKGERFTQNGCNDNLMREYYYLREFNKHPYITKIYEIIFTETSVYMILEYYPEGDLFEYLAKRKRIPIEEALSLFTQILGSVCYVHKSGCCHRDLKLENILLDKKLNVKLSDFGFTRELPFAQYGAKSLLNEVCGTTAYMAPELLRKEPYSGIKTDIWALGVILFTMISGEMPFDDSLAEDQLVESVLTVEPTFNESLFKPEVQKLIQALLSKNPDDRPVSIDSILRMPLFQPYGGMRQLEIINKMMYDGGSSTSFSGSERMLLKDLVSVGFDKEMLKRSIGSNHLDSVVGFWELLKEKNKKKSHKKKIKYRSRSMLRLSTSRSFIENAKMTFSPSSSMNSYNQNSFLSRLDNNLDPQVSTGINGHGHTTHSVPHNAEQTQAHSPTELSSELPLHTHFAEMNSNRPISFNSSVNSKPLEEPSTTDGALHDNDGISRKSFDIKSLASTATSTMKKKHRFSLKTIFEKLKKSKGSEGQSISSSVVNSESRTSLKSPASNKEETNALVEGSPKKQASNTRTSTTSIVVIEPDHSESEKRSSSAQLDSISLRRNKPTRPGSVISSYSVQTTMSETSNGSGYVTGYSTDNQGQNGHHSNPATPGGSNSNNNRPAINRGVSDWSVNSKVAEQPESPNSSFTTLSRSNSLDSLTRSLRGRRRKRNSSGLYGGSNNTILKRGKSPLHSKLNTKWNFNNRELSSSGKKFSKETKQPQQQQIIEEEIEDEEEDHDELLNEPSYADAEMDEEDLEGLEGDIDEDDDGVEDEAEFVTEDDEDDHHHDHELNELTKKLSSYRLEEGQVNSG